MKKTTFLLIALLSLQYSFSQTGQNTFTNKKGNAILPDSSDFGLGFDATPFLNFAGNLLSSSGNNSVNAFWDNTNQAISGKYFKNASTAYRANLRLAMSSYKEQIMDDSSNILRDSIVSSTSIILGFGIEKRRGKGRIQGYYGGDLMLGLNSAKTKVNYTQNSTFYTDRFIESNNPGGFSFGLLGVVGIEYFILPKLSLGAEYNWGIIYNSTGSSDETKEFTEGNNVTKVKRGKTSNLVLDTGNNAGAIRLMIYF
jgi:hypothetical protein